MSAYNIHRSTVMLIKQSNAEYWHSRRLILFMSNANDIVRNEATKENYTKYAECYENANR